MGVTVNNPASNGLPSGPQLVPGGQSAVPVILPSSGTITNGVLSALTALPTAYGGAWMYFPAGASLPSGAGLYWVSSVTTTGGNITTSYANASTAFTPYIPASPVLITSGGAAYTQTTGADITLANITVPGGLMGANGSLRNTVLYGVNNTAGAKTPKFMFGGSVFGGGTIPLANATGAELVRQTRNRGVQNSQVSYGTSALQSFGAGSPQYFAIDTSQNQPITFTGQLAVATDYIVLEGFTVEVLPS